MPKLILISARTARMGVQEKGDIIGIVPDDYKFSPDELLVFDFEDITEEEANEMKANEDFTIKVVDLFMDGSIIAWEDTKEGKWKLLKNKPGKFFNRYDQQTRKTISKIKEKPENNETEVVVELRPIEV